jgi:hypothetical protein
MSKHQRPKLCAVQRVGRNSDRKAVRKASIAWLSFALRTPSGAGQRR